MKYFEENYVGYIIRNGEAPLAFLTPYEDNVNGKKRQESVNNWIKYNSNFRGAKKFGPEIIKNEPRTGFKIVGSSSRWSTSNKHARIYDPEGYQLEITIENLIELLQEVTVEKGRIKDKMIWLRNGANNYLSLYDSERYKKATNPKREKAISYNIGDVGKDSYNNEYQYLGKVNIEFESLGFNRTKVFSQQYRWNTISYENKRDPNKVIKHTLPTSFHLYIDQHDRISLLKGKKKFAKKGKPRSIKKINHLYDQYSFKHDEKGNIFYLYGRYYDKDGQELDMKHSYPDIDRSQKVIFHYLDI